MIRKFLAPAVGVLVLGLAACGGGAAASKTDSTETSTEASTQTSADTVGSITLYTSEPQAKIDELVAEFNVAQPNVKVEVFRAGTGDLTTRIEAELAAGEVQADVLLAADAPTFDKYVAQDLFAPLKVDTSNVLAEVIDPKGFYVGTRVIPTVIAYNTDAVETPPQTWQELTDSSYKGKLVMPNPDVSGAAAFNAAVWMLNPDMGEPWLNALAANQPVIADSNGPVSQAVATGTQPIGIVVDYLVRDLAAQGSPIAVSYPSEGVPYVFQPVGVFSSSKNQDAAMIFADWLISTEGQDLAVKQNYLPVRTDVTSPAGAPTMDELKLMAYDLEKVSASKKDAVTLFNSLFQ
ncbi:MAG: ABC transporter substrate-binding protein [Actinomycetaceae bacterium]|nr:ABC transporter substrate-binding protein [Actinomycetaceae bacterium]